MGLRSKAPRNIDDYKITVDQDNLPPGVTVLSPGGL
jgi:hypothetical protein